MQQIKTLDDLYNRQAKKLMLNIIVQDPEKHRLITQVMAFAVPIKE